MKKIVLIVLVSLLLSSAEAGAIEIQDDWINLSVWAYNDVSNFTNEGLLPDSFNGITDYRADITRLQFAELTYSVFCVSTDIDGTLSSRFKDTDNYAANILATHGVLKGATEADENGQTLFMPENKITREDAAVIAHRAGHFRIPFMYEYDEFGNRFLLEKPDLIFADKSEISDYATEAVWYLNSIGVVSGMADNSFDPKSNVTIEQAISMLYRLYQKLPATPKVDGALDDSGEEILLQTYDNGFTETRRSNHLYIKNGDKTVMSFETDMYFNLNCAEVNGKTYILARNFKKRTEVYDRDTKKSLFTVPHSVMKVKNGYMYTVSSDKDEYLCGLYDFNGKEILPNEYSEHELDMFIKNGLASLKTARREPDGWIYYSDADNLYLHRVDSNGENDTIILEKEALHLHYANGWLYCLSTMPQYSLFAVRADGSGYTEITEDSSFLIPNAANDEYVSSDGYVYYISSENNTLWRSMPTDRGITAEQACAMRLDLNPILYNDKIFFLDEEQCLEDRDYPKSGGTSYVYCFDGKETKCVLDKRVSDMYIKDIDGKAYLIAQTGNTDISYQIDLDTLKYTRTNALFSAYHPSEPKTDEYIKINAYSDDNYIFYRNYARDTLAFSEADGKITQIDSESGANVIGRFKNIVYYEKMYSTNGGEGLYAYDMAKKERVKITDNFCSVLNGSDIEYILNEGDTINFTDRHGNIYHLIAGALEPVHIYPHSSLNNYGKSVRVIETDITCGKLRKLDENGIYSKITDAKVASWCYVENGKEKRNFN